MKQNTFCIIGLGSMGKRRARLLRQIDDSCTLIGVDNRADRRLDFEKIFLGKSFSALEDVFIKEQLNAVFICTSPLSHYKIKEQLDKYKIHTFSEINLVSDGYDSIVDNQESRSFLSSTNLYAKEIIKIQSLVNTKNKYFYTYHVGQYLPDWHPWDKKEDFFIFEKKCNGCREILGIELPWLIECFGIVKSIKVISGRFTKLDISFPDTYNILIEHKNGTIGSFSVDVVSRKPVKQLRIQNEEQLIEWNGEADGLKIFNSSTNEMESIELYKKISHEDNYSSKIIEEPYLEEIKDFLEGVKNSQHIFKYSYEKDKYIIDLLDEIEG